MRRTITLLSVFGMLLALSVPATAEEHPPSLDHPHSHALLIGVDIEWIEPTPGAPPYVIHGFDKCVELAGGKALKHNRFHENIHFGRAGQALGGAGHLVVPVGFFAQIFGFEDSCAGFEAFLNAAGSFPPPPPPSE
jgi:hypothetical protein